MLQPHIRQILLLLHLLLPVRRWPGNCPTLMQYALLLGVLSTTAIYICLSLRPLIVWIVRLRAILLLFLLRFRLVLLLVLNIIFRFRHIFLFLTVIIRLSRRLLLFLLTIVRRCLVFISLILAYGRLELLLLWFFVGGGYWHFLVKRLL